MTLTQSSAARIAVALIIPVVAGIIQWIFWPALQPFVWFLFYPAIFVSSRIGGLVGGLGATALSAILVLFVFMPPEWSWQLSRPENAYSIVIFLFMGLLFSATHEQLRRAFGRIERLYGLEPGLRGPQDARPTHLPFLPLTEPALMARVDELLAQQVRTARALTLSQDMHRKLFDNMRNGLAYCRMIFDGDRPVDWIYLAVNPAFEEQTGLRGSAGRRVSEVIPGLLEADRGLFEMYGRVARTGVPATFETEVRALNEWFSVSAYSPEPDHFVAVFDVVTTKKKAELELRQLSQAVEQSPVSIVITDTTGSIQYVNAKFCAVTGYSADEVRGQNPRLLKSGEMPREGYRELWETISSGREWHGRFHNRRKNGELFWEDARISPIKTADGGVSGYLAVKEDITEHRKLEEQLRHAQRLDAIGQLAGGVAHDFNNILAASMMHLGLLQMGDSLDAEARAELQEIQRETERAASLTRQLLMFSRKSVLNVQPADLNAVIDGLLKMLRRLIGEDIDLRYDAGSTALPIMADVGMIEQVMVNLVVNARDAMPKGGRVAIRTFAATLSASDVTTNPLHRSGTFSAVSVDDTGIGMDEATQARIFEPFFTTKEAGKGTGLGLATVHGIVAQHGGWIEVESHPGMGSRFSVYLPMGVQAVTEAVDDEPRQIPKGAGERILMVEDEETLRVSVSALLRSLGYDVVEAGSGREAMDRWLDRGGAFDLLLTDVVMPEGMTGLDLARRLRELKPSLPVILSSGYSPELASGGISAAEQMVYLPKPYDSDVLARTVRSSLDTPLA